MASPNLNATARHFKSLHANLSPASSPTTPLLLSNVYDVTSARLVASHPDCKALATASFAISASQFGIRDNDLTLSQNLSVIRQIAPVAREFDKPLSVDIQDGYGEHLEDLIREIVRLGVVGVNLEDSDHTSEEMMSEDVAVQRIKRVMEVAEEEGVPDFVINARSDSFLMGASLEESIRRGKLYLEAGATTVFIFWPPPGERVPFMKHEDVQKVVSELGGRVNLSPTLPLGTSRTLEDAKGDKGRKGLGVADLAMLGPARVSVGPKVYLAASDAIKGAAGAVYAAGEAGLLNR